MEPRTGDICKCGYNAEENPFALPPGSILNGRYLLGRVLGHGGFGITYIGFDITLESKVAVKEYVPEGLASRIPGISTIKSLDQKKDVSFQDGIRKFLEEAKTIARFKTQQNIVPVKDFFMANGTAYLVMEYIEGESLQAHLRSMGGKIGWNEMMHVVWQLVGALMMIHEKGFLHRDIAPDNIYITDNKHVWLLDFGSARQNENEGNKTMTAIVKAGFAPMEQYGGSAKQGPWSDIYALAATIYYSITSVMPPNPFDRMEQDSLQAPSQMGISIPPQSEAALMKALSLRPEQRFPTVGQFWEQLNVRDDGAAAPIMMNAPTAAQTRAGQVGLAGQVGQAPTATMANGPRTTFVNVEQEMLAQTYSSQPPVTTHLNSSVDQASLSKSMPAKKNLLMPIGAGLGVVAIICLSILLVNSNAKRAAESADASKAIESASAVAMAQTDNSAQSTQDSSQLESTSTSLEAGAETPPPEPTPPGPPPDSSGTETLPSEPVPPSPPAKSPGTGPLPSEPTPPSPPAKSPGTGVLPSEPTPPKPTAPPAPTSGTTTVKPPADSASTKIVYPNGDVFIGSIVGGKANGKGTYTFSTGAVYVGDFVNDAATGTGTLTYADGSYYTGGFKDNLFSGTGKFVYSNGSVYIGEVLNGAANGSGELQAANGRTYTGTFQDNYIVYGTLLFPNGEVYEGDFYLGVPNGSGAYYFNDGITFDGTWVSGVMSNGTFYDVNGNPFVMTDYDTLVKYSPIISY